MLYVKPERSAVSRETVDVEDGEAVRSKHLLGHEHREIGKMLVVDRVELAASHQLEKMRNFDRDHAVIAQQDGHPCDEVVEIGNVRQDVVSDDQIGWSALQHDLVRGLCSEE